MLERTLDLLRSLVEGKDGGAWRKRGGWMLREWSLSPAGDRGIFRFGQAQARHQGVPTPSSVEMSIHRMPDFEFFLNVPPPVETMVAFSGDGIAITLAFLS